jgi:hypothetical protein
MTQQMGKTRLMLQHVIEALARGDVVYIQDNTTGEYVRVVGVVPNAS